MNNRTSGVTRAGVVLAYFAVGLMWCAHAGAYDESRPAVIAAHAQEHPVRLPALTLGGIRSGHAMMITETGVETANLAEIEQPQMSKPPPFAGVCIRR